MSPYFPYNNTIITGGLGFIGSNLALKLISNGIPCTLIDSLNPNYGGNFFNISSIANSPLLTVNISDIRDHYSLTPLFSNTKSLFNFAGQTSHMDSMSQPLVDLDINAKAQLSLLEVCKSSAPDINITFASTRQLYGVPQYLPVDELHPTVPVDVNGINKLAGEMYHLLYSRVHDIPSSVLRLTNTYGPRMRIKDSRQTFLGIWIKSILTHSQFEVWGGDQLRDYTYVDDCVDALIATNTSPHASNQIFNLGGFDQPISLLETAEILVQAASEVGIPLLSRPFILKDFPSDRKKIDIGDYYSSSEKIKSTLNWEPRVSLLDGFKRTLVFYRENLDHYI